MTGRSSSVAVVELFVYQGFNERVGWMHTSSGVDAVDEYAETIVRKGDD